MTISLDFVHHIVPLLFAVAGLLGTLGRWSAACWPLVLAASVVWLVLGA